MSQGEEKTEEASQHKLNQARKKGQVGKSADVSAFFSLLLAFFSMCISGLWAYEKLLAYCHKSFRSADLKLIAEGYSLWFYLSMPIMFAAMLGGILGNLIQFGFLLSSESIKPKWQKIDPIAGFKKLFSKDRLFELGKQLIKFGIIFIIIYQTVIGEFSSIINSYNTSLNSALSALGDVVFTLFWRVILVFLFLAVLDWFWQKYSFAKSMRMSKAEVKKEYKQQEGDPQIKQERKRFFEEMLEESSQQNIAESSVVITNPSHIATAIRYSDGTDQAPILIAKAQGSKALKLISDAHKNSIPVIRNVPLARSLIWLKINEEIPEKHYEAVAEILCFLAELEQKSHK